MFFEARLFTAPRKHDRGYQITKSDVYLEMGRLAYTVGREMTTPPPPKRRQGTWSDAERGVNIQVILIQDGGSKTIGADLQQSLGFSLVSIQVR